MGDTDWLLPNINTKTELQRLRASVDAARARLAELEAGFTIREFTK